jgi:probable rRNA maturation factor
VIERRIEINLGEGVDAGGDVEPLLERAVSGTLDHEGIGAAAISVTLVGDIQIANLNAQYLQHEGPTDVLSFPLYESGEAPVGDIYIGFDQAGRQAIELGVALEAELARLAIHGTLHVLGYDHPDNEAREGSEMWKRQENILRLILHH